MQGTAWVCLVLLLCETQITQSRPEGGGGDNLKHQASTGHDHLTALYNQEIAHLNTKWADLENNRHDEYQTAALRCKRLLLQHKPRVLYIVRVSVAKLSDRKRCNTAISARNIVSAAMAELAYNLDVLVDGLRGILLLISNVFMSYFKLMVARSHIYAPKGAAKFEVMFEEIVKDEKLLDIGAQARNTGILLINNAVRYFSGIFNPPLEFGEKLKALEAGTKLDETKLEQYRADAMEQIVTVGNIVENMVDALDDTAYQSIKLFTQSMRIFLTHKAIFNNPIFFSKLDSIGDVEDCNEKIRLSLRLVKNLKAAQIMFGQRPLVATVGDTEITAVDEDEKD